MAKDRIYALSERDARILKQKLREFDRRPFNMQPTRRNPVVQGTGIRYRFRNNSGERIPPGAIMRKTGTEIGAEGGLVHVMNKPSTSEFNPPFYVNLGEEIGTDGAEAYGWCATFEDEIGRAYHLSGTPAYGESWGPKGGQWELEQYYPGFIIEGDPQDGLVLVRQQQPKVLIAQSDSGGIPARSSTTLGSDDGVTIYYRNGATVGATTFVITAYNEAAAPVAGSKYLQLVREGTGWLANWEEC